MTGRSHRLLIWKADEAVNRNNQFYSTQKEPCDCRVQEAFPVFLWPMLSLRLGNLTDSGGGVVLPAWHCTQHRSRYGVNEVVP